MTKSNSIRPYFSIVIPTLDEEICLPLLLRDLSLQSWTDFEIIHVDGGSKDRTLERARDWEKQLNLRTISHDVKNVSSQRNRGAIEANGEWIIFMDADNRLPSYFLIGVKYQIERAESEPKNKFDLFSTRMHLIKEDKRDPRNHTVVSAINMFMRTTSKTNRPMVSGSMIGIRQRIARKIRFNEKMKVSEDSNFVKDCVKAGWKYAFLTSPTYAFSMRRIKSNGIVKTATSSIIMNLSYLMGGDMSKANHGYEMLGGGAYVDNKKSK